MQTTPAHSSICANCRVTINPATDPSFCSVCGSGDRHIVIHDATELKISEGVGRTARTRFAEAWFDDAKREALPTTAGDLHARRREIIFSVVCVESYLVEWAFDLVATRFADADLADALQSYFPKRSNPIGLWTEVPRRLHEDGYLPKLLEEYTENHAEDFARLIDYRNDITHANVSYPDVLSSEPGASKQVRTTTTALTELPPGWAMGVAAQRIQELHRETDTTPPEWSTVPTMDQEDVLS